MRWTTRGTTAGGPGRLGNRWSWPGTAEQGAGGCRAHGTWGALTAHACYDYCCGNTAQVQGTLLKFDSRPMQNHLQKEFVHSGAGEMTGSEAWPQLTALGTEPGFVFPCEVLELVCSAKNNIFLPRALAQRKESYISSPEPEMPPTPCQPWWWRQSQSLGGAGCLLW